MPLLVPNKKQTKEQFMKNCLSNPTTNKEFTNNSQRYAVCMSLWKKSKKKSTGSIEEISELDWEKFDKQSFILY